MAISRSTAALFLVLLVCIGMANGADAGSTRRRNNRRNRDTRDRAHADNANAGIDKAAEQQQDQRELFHRLENEEIIIGRGGVEKIIKLPSHANGGPKPKVDGPDDEEEPSDEDTPEEEDGIEDEEPSAEEEESDEDPHDEDTHHD